MKLINFGVRVNGVNILHLTDIHIGNKNFPYDNVKDMAIRIGEVFEDLQKKVDIVLVTGDIFNGKSNYDIDEEKIIINDGCLFFGTLLERLKINSNANLTKEDFLFLPGNHDINRNAKNDIELFNLYRKFLKAFYYDTQDVYSLYNKRHLYCIRIFKESKIILIGFNSCKFEKYTPLSDDYLWIKDMEFSNISSSNELCIKKMIHAKYEETLKLNKYDDFGNIDIEQYTEVMDLLKTQIDNFTEYTTVAAFHHHFYPFPEVKSGGDNSLLRNFSNIKQKLIKINTKLILHGHKHLRQITPVLDDNTWDISMYAISGGDIGNKEQWDRNFQFIEVYNHNQYLKFAHIYMYNFKGDKLEQPEEIFLPPVNKDEVSSSQNLLDIIENENQILYKNYLDNIYDCDNISRDSRIDSVIENISNVFTSFLNIKNKLLKNPDEALYLVLFAHYKTIMLNCLINKVFDDKILDSIKDYFISIAKCDENFADLIFNYIKYVDEIEKDKSYELLKRANLTSKQKYIKSLAVTSDIFVELYLVLTKFTDYYYEKYSHCLNIKLKKNVFSKLMPSHYIRFLSHSDRRTITIKLKSKDPTCHKVAVMLIKVFENRLAKYDEDFDELSLKIFYIRPDIEKDSYSLEDYNYEAYIPNLLPLLIGDNIYKQQEVFIREIIQNSFDAIILRRELTKGTKDCNFNQDIRISFGRENRLESLGSEQKEGFNYIRIDDNGIGMTLSQVERYFIHIARSYYNSEEYNELAEKNKIKHKPISKFGIGFLSSFLFAKEIKVITLSYLKGYKGVDIHIPNHEGCFFSRENEHISKPGTTIILNRKNDIQIKSQDIINYMEKTILDLQLDVYINGFDENEKTIDIKIDALGFRKKLLNSFNPVFFVPLNENGLLEVDYADRKAFDTEPYGILFKFSTRKKSWENFRGEYVEMNGGILLNDGSILLKPSRYENYFMDIYINYPPYYVDLDVSREKIKNFTKQEGRDELYFSNAMKQQILISLKKQTVQWLKEAINKKYKMPLICVYRLYRFFALNNLSVQDIQKQLFYGIQIKFNKRSITFKFAKSSDYNDELISIDSPYDATLCVFNNIKLLIPIVKEYILENSNIDNFIKDRKFGKYAIINELKNCFEIDKKIFNVINVENISIRYLDIIASKLLILVDDEYTYEKFTKDRLSDEIFKRSNLSQNITLIKGNTKVSKLLDALMWDFTIFFVINVLKIFYDSSIEDAENYLNKNVLKEKLVNYYLSV
jgi:hypothetical protein